MIDPKLLAQLEHIDPQMAELVRNGDIDGMKRRCEALSSIIMAAARNVYELAGQPYGGGDEAMSRWLEDQAAMIQGPRTTNP